jgi:hypothetical protein
MPKIFTNDVLPASDLNSFMLQPGTAGTGTRLVAGSTTAVGVSGSAHTGTITYGFTFGGTVVLVGTVKCVTGAGMILQWTAAPGTTSAAYRVALRDPGDSLAGESYTIHWVAIG